MHDVGLTNATIHEKTSHWVNADMLKCCVASGACRIPAIRWQTILQLQAFLKAIELPAVQTRSILWASVAVFGTGIARAT